ncbi:mechanosensitive ion channel [Ramlibacter sp. RBP-2]|uniref:Mechanosensitive ion channel n=1 Tax=Ramlibacter lithotrophicus TaxID=2606681 RepID=A0A7X6I5C6_9BURK|nr:mechanosensitive ion channel domain-containing protein [Ramlibacter lithotrophicus]NKE65198.1 mechanosensitive ion channel [Ramlibacter lithotrophicus]
MTPLDELLQRLAHPALAVEAAVLAGCLALAFALSWLIGRRHSTESVWFGRATVDGLLFALLALVFTYSASLALRAAHPVPLLRMAVPVLVSLAGIRFIARVFTVVFPKSGVARLVERLFSWLAWIAAVLWIVGLLPAVMREMDEIHLAFGTSRISLLAIVNATLSAGAVLVVALWISAAVERKVLREAVTDLSLRKVAANAVRALLLLVGLLFALSAVGVDLTAFSVLGGALGVGIGFGLQKLAANYVSGFVILFERSLRIGDTVRVDGFEGIVVDIKTRYTLIRSLSGLESIVPNEKLITERIENLSLADPRVLITTDVTVGYDSDVAQVERLLVEAAAGVDRVVADPAPAARLANLGADGLEFKLLFWIADPQAGELGVRSAVNIRVLQALRGAGIDIPYPQRVVHVRRAPAAAPAGAA